MVPADTRGRSGHTDGHPHAPTHTKHTRGGPVRTLSALEPPLGRASSNRRTPTASGRRRRRAAGGVAAAHLVVCSTCRRFDISARAATSLRVKDVRRGNAGLKTKRPRMVPTGATGGDGDVEVGTKRPRGEPT